MRRANKRISLSRELFSISSIIFTPDGVVANQRSKRRKAYDDERNGGIWRERGKEREGGVKDREG